ncbi:MAG: PSP1 domain-containing protein [Symbiobacteriia bacterium]
MPVVVGIRFKKAGKVYYFDPGELPLAAGGEAIVETARGLEYGNVVVGPKDVPETELVQPIKRVLRPASEQDRLRVQDNKRREREAFDTCLKKIAGHELDMYLVDVEYTFDSSKIVFYFTAEGRVDFRDLVKDLASVFRTRIELRQIGVRDEAKILGGLGPCGRPTCCSTFLGDFAPVSIRMAKDQNLSLNPTKISGLCGRLMCCLRYENDVYEEAKAALPNLGQRVMTADGEGRVIGLNPLKNAATVELVDRTVREYAATDVGPFTP